jgi:hypothetical protein
VDTCFHTSARTGSTGPNSLVFLLHGEIAGKQLRSEESSLWRRECFPLRLRHCNLNSPQVSDDVGKNESMLNKHELIWVANDAQCVT